MDEKQKKYEEVLVQIEDRIQKYNQTLKDGQNKLRISPWGELEFEKIYVVPHLSKTPEPDEELGDGEEDPEKDEAEEDDRGEDEAEDQGNIDRESPTMLDSTNTAFTVTDALESSMLSIIPSTEDAPSEIQPRDMMSKIAHMANISGLHNTSQQLWLDFEKDDFIQRYLLFLKDNLGHNQKHKKVIQIEEQDSRRIFYPYFPMDRLTSQESLEASIVEREEQISKLFENDDIVYVIGGAGYGKSLFLRKLCVSPQMLCGFTERPLLIIRGDIKRLVRDDGTHRTMHEFLGECFAHNSLCGSDENNQDFITECLKAGRCMLLLDALDEVGNEHRDVIHDLIISQFTNLYPGNKICITSRERGFIPRRNITCFYIRAIAPRDVEEYVDRFIAIRKFDNLQRDGFVTEATGLVKKKFAKGFLTLSLLLTIYHKEGKLPNNKLQLYEKCFEYMANLREKEKDLIRNSRTGQNYNWENLDIFLTDETFMQLAKCGTPNNKDISERSIRKLMLDMYKKEFPSSTSCKLATDEFLQFCSDRTEVFVPSQNSNSDYRFFHRSFYEYFYAKYIDKNAENEEETCEMLWNFDMDSEIYELLTMLYKDEGNSYKTNNLAKYLFEKAQKSLRNGTNPDDRGFDMLVMLVYALNDKEFQQQFTDLFFEEAEGLSGQTLTVNFGMLGAILTRDTGYFMRQFEEDERDCLAMIQEKLLRYCLNHIQECFALLKKVKNRKYEVITREDINAQKVFAFPELILLLPDCYGKIDRFFTRFADRKHLIAVKKLQNRQVNMVCEFATKVNEMSPQERIQIYHYMLIKA